eukprot:1378224-Amorphochlora_amoeboformis.AAC.1
MDASIRARCKSLEARIRELEAENQNLRLKLAGREKMEVLGEKKEKKSAEGAQMAPVVPSAHTHGLSLEQVRRSVGEVISRLGTCTLVMFEMYIGTYTPMRA